MQSYIKLGDYSAVPNIHNDTSFNGGIMETSPFEWINSLILNSLMWALRLPKNRQYRNKYLNCFGMAITLSSLIFLMCFDFPEIQLEPDSPTLIFEIMYVL
eukprot:143739_1